VTASTPETGTTPSPETGPSTPPETGTAPPPETGTDEATDWRAEADKWRALSQKNEQRAKENASAAKELEKVRRAAMNDQELAVALARDEAAAEATAAAVARYGGRLVIAEIRAAVGARLSAESFDALTERLDLAGFLTPEGDVDREAVARFAQSVAPDVTPSPSFPDLGQGPRSSNGGDPFANDPLLKSLKGKLGIHT
jgi:hypothetical protein